MDGHKLVQKEKWDGGEAHFIHEMHGDEWIVVFIQILLDIAPEVTWKYKMDINFADDDLWWCPLRAPLQARIIG